MRNHFQMRKRFALTVLLTLCACCISIPTVFSQIVYTDLAPDLNLMVSFGSNVSSNTPLDLDNNGSTDFHFAYNANSGVSDGSNRVEWQSSAQNSVGYRYSARNSIDDDISSSPTSPMLWQSANQCLLADNYDASLASDTDTYIGVIPL